MKYDAKWWKEELGEACERLKKDAKEVSRIHELSNACGKWNSIVKNQLEAMKLGCIKPDSKNMPDVIA
jgi:hypothetical protein